MQRHPDRDSVPSPDATVTAVLPKLDVPLAERRLSAEGYSAAGCSAEGYSTDGFQSAPRPRLQISATSVTAGAVASVAAAVLGSTLGVAGTVAGAALGAVVSSVASALYQHSVATARYRVHQLRGSIPRAAQQERAVGGGAAVHGDRLRPDGRRPVWFAVAGAALALAVALVVVTGIESVKGSPLAGGPSGGLSVLGGGHAPASGADVDESDPQTVDSVPAGPPSTAPSESTVSTDSSPATSSPAEPTESDSAAPQPTSGPTTEPGGDRTTGVTVTRTETATVTGSPTATVTVTAEPTHGPGGDDEAGGPSTPSGPTTASGQGAAVDEPVESSDPAR